MAPACSTCAGVASVISRSRSVAFISRLAPSERQEHVRKDRDGVSPFDHAVDMVQRFQKVGPLESNTHGCYAFNHCRAGEGTAAASTACPAARRKDVDRQNGRREPQKQGVLRPLPQMRDCMRGPPLPGSPLTHKGREPGLAGMVDRNDRAGSDWEGGVAKAQSTDASEKDRAAAFRLHEYQHSCAPAGAVPLSRATPIGNLGDITLRALETLAGAMCSPARTRG